MCGDTTGLCAFGDLTDRSESILCLSGNAQEKIDKLLNEEKYILTSLSINEIDVPWLIRTSNIFPWSIFDPYPFAHEIVTELEIIPKGWALTPLQNKKPFRNNWQNEEPLYRNFIEEILYDGEVVLSKKGNEYIRYASGIGVRTGDVSDGLFVIDVDGASAQFILNELSNGDIPITVSWLSGKKGRIQLAFQITDEHRELLKDFRKVAIKEFNDVKADDGEQLELRYNGMQSCLPPSRHPDTGSYKWGNSPETTEVAIAPDWLINYLKKIIEEGKTKTQYQKGSKLDGFGKSDGFGKYVIPDGEVNGWVSFAEKEVIPRLTFDQTFFWTGHDWQQFGTTMKGKPPFRQSQSGTSFHAWYDGNHWAWQDKSTGAGGGAIQYWWMLKGNSGTPKGKDYINLVKEMAQVAGIAIPEFKKSKSNNINKTPEQLAEESAQLETEKLAHQQIVKTDFEKLEQQGLIIKRVNVPNLTPEIMNLEKGKISIVISAMGTSKTECTKHFAPSYDAIYSWHTRITLAMKMAEDLREHGMLYKDDAEKNHLNKKVSFCANSAHKFHPKHLRCKGLVLVDEADQVLEYMSGSLCNKDGMRPYILAMLEAHLNTALIDGSALFMSADINQKEIDLIKSIAPKDAKIEIIINEYVPTRGKLQFSTDPKPDALVNQLLETLEQGTPCYLLDDFKDGYRGCRTIAQYIKSKHPEWADYIVEINGDTSELPEIKDFIKHINEESIQKNILLISCSPSVTSGISLTNGRFNNGVYGIINGILTPNNAAQGLSRVRGANNIYVWVSPRGINFEKSGGITPQDVNNFYQGNYEKRNKILLSFHPSYNPMSEEWESPHWKLFCQNSALKNIEMRKLRNWCQQKLISTGYQLEEKEFGINPNTEEFLKDTWGNLQLKDIEAIGNSKDITKTDAEILRNKSQSGENLSREERLQLLKFHLRVTFGDELINSAKTPHPSRDKEELLEGIEAIAYLNWGGKLEKQLMRQYRNFHQPDFKIAISDLYMEEKQQQREISDSIDIPGCDRRFPKDIEWKLREYKLWEYLEFEKYLNPNREYYPSDYQPLIDKVRSQLEQIKQVTGYSFEKANDGLIINLLYRMHGLDLENTRKRNKGDKETVRKITKKSWEFAQKFIAHWSSKLLDKDKWANPPIILVKSDFKGGFAQSAESLPHKQSSCFQGENTLKSDGVLEGDTSNLISRDFIGEQISNTQYQNEHSISDIPTITIAELINEITSNNVRESIRGWLVNQNIQTEYHRSKIIREIIEYLLSQETFNTNAFRACCRFFELNTHRLINIISRERMDKIVNLISKG